MEFLANQNLRLLDAFKEGALPDATFSLGVGPLSYFIPKTPKRDLLNSYCFKHGIQIVTH